MGTKGKKGRKSKEIASKQQPDDMEAKQAGTTDKPKASVSNEKMDVENKKSYRKRKRHYFNGIREQMEFYFGDANLSKDRFLKQLIDKDPYVPLDIFLTFNKMKGLTERVEDIAKSLSKSDLLELDETQKKVKRITALSENRNVDEKTLYVEALPPTADHEWVRQIFERFGNVAYISLPKYAKSRKIKEFGFVEFEKEDSVNKAVKVFKEFNGVLCMQEKDPSDLMSVTSYIKEQAGEESENVPMGETRKRIKQETGDDTEPKAKKIKTESHDEKDGNTSPNTEEATSISESEVNEEAKIKIEDMDEDPNKKKRRKRKKKSKSGESLKRKAELKTDVSYYELKVLPKKDWKRLRNKYLNLQREKVSELKRKAWRERQETKQQSKDVAKEEINAQTPEKDEQKKTKTSKHKLEKMNMNFYGAAAEEEPQVKTNTTEKAPQVNPALERPPLFTYEPGLIVEVSFLEPCVNIKEYKADMRQYPSVKYVDVKEGSMQAYLRLESPNEAKEFVQQISCAEYQSKILFGDSESTYWQKIEKDREQKLNKQVKIPQKRGREKVKKLITQHIRFTDDDE